MRQSIYARFDQEIETFGDNLPLLQSGLFDGSLTKLRAKKQQVDGILEKYGVSMY